MEKWIKMLTVKHRIILSVIFDLISVVACVWFYNYAIGTSIFSLVSVLYSFVCSFVITYSTFLIIKKDGLKNIFQRKILSLYFLLLQFFYLLCINPLC